MIELDGSTGGGAMLRVALAMSEATGKPFRMSNIRKNRPQPGLKQQHLIGIKALQELSGAKVSDAHPGSNELLYIPGEKMKSSIVIDAQTAAPATLIMQALLPAIIAQGKKVIVDITSGTDTAWSPQIDYFTHVLAKLLEKLAQIVVKLELRGYYPKGQGKMRIIVTPKKPTRLEFTERGPLLKLGGKSHAAFALEPAQVAQRQLQAARMLIEQHYLAEQGEYPLDMRAEYHDTKSVGSGITVWAHYRNTSLGADKLGEKGVIAERVGEEAAKTLITLLNSKAVIDPYAADQLIVYLALFGGEIITSQITEHALANIHICEQFLEKKFVIEENKISY